MQSKELAVRWRYGQGKWKVKDQESRTEESSAGRSVRLDSTDRGGGTEQNRTEKGEREGKGSEVS